MFTGADVTKNDGVYSRFFTDFTGVGYYGIQISVDNNQGKAIIIDSVPFSKARPIVDPDEAFNLPAIGEAKFLKAISSRLFEGRKHFRISFF